MKISNVLLEIKNKLPYVVSTYGNITNFIYLVKQSLYLDPDVNILAYDKQDRYKILNYLLTLLQNYKNLNLISPWDFLIDLKDLRLNNLSNINSIDLDSPYHIHDINGNLLYSVTDHNGIFGISELDKYLINNSSNADLYFLKYKCLSGFTKVQVILVNLFSKSLFNSNVNKQRETNYLQSSNLTIVNTIGTEINYYFLSGSFISGNINDFLRDEFLFSLSNNNSISIPIQEGAYIYFKDKSLTIEKTQLTFLNNDLIFVEHINDSTLIYVAYGLDPSIINSKFSTNVLFSDKIFNDVITLRN